MRARLWMTKGCRILLQGGDPAPLVNALNEAHISISDLRGSADTGYRLETDESSVSELMETAKRMGYSVSISGKTGVGRFFRRFRLRPEILLVPFALCILTLWFSTMIWDIEITGNKTISNGEILSALEEVGIYPGVSGLHIDNPKIRSCLQERIPALSWCTVQVHGSRALVIVRERVEPPKVVDESEYGDLIARKSGVIELPGIREGKSAVKKGDLVLEGQLLASGTLTDRQSEVRFVHALGEVWAQTWYEKTLEMPLELLEPIISEKTKRRYALKICDFRVNFYTDSGISHGDYVKMESEVRPAIGGLSLPFSLVKTELREYDAYPLTMTRESAEALLRERLLLWLDGETDDAEQLSVGFASSETEGILRVTLHAVCREQIAEEKPYTDNSSP